MGRSLGNQLFGSKKKILIFEIIMILFFVGNVSAAHYISGYVNDALDGERADNHIIVAWNPANGILDNLTDVIGVNGNAMFQGVFMVDCEMLNDPCLPGDEIRVKVVDSGDGYVSLEKSVIVTTAGYDEVENITLNSIPSSYIVFPENNDITNKDYLEIVCGFLDLDEMVGTVSLYSNFSGEWSLFESKEASFEVPFSVSLSDGSYSYYCSSNDGLVSSNSLEQKIIVDKISPIINSFFLNESFFCGETSLNVSCYSSDLNGINNTFIEVFSPLGFENYTSISGSYLFNVSEKGSWNFTCFSVDMAGNVAKSSTESIFAYSGFPDLVVDSLNISFSKEFPMEKEKINISVDFFNEGCSLAENFSVSFFLGNPNFSGSLFGVESSFVDPFSSQAVSVEYESLIGVNDIFVFLDFENYLKEDSRANNVANKILNVPAWQEFYGNITSIKVLGDMNLTSWDNHTKVSGNVFVADSESMIDWSSLVAIGKNILGEDSFNDFFEIDELLGMANYLDSVSNVYSESMEKDYFLRKKNISFVPSIFSTEENSFFTGILWDSSDDSDGEFGLLDKEDLVFVSNINKSSEGKYGVYDYEIRIPAKLREYDNSDSSEVYFYYEII